jgi:protein phosphatase
MHVRCHGLTHPGKVRSSNEDHFLIARLHRSLIVEACSLEDHERLQGSTHGYLFVVADGMGGHAAGEHASSIAVQTIERFVLHTTDWFFRLRQRYEEDLLDELKAGLMECQKQVMVDQTKHPEHHGMGTTITMAYVLWPRMFVVHVGDSRLYFLRGGKLAQVTTDHTMAQQYVAAGMMSQEEANDSKWSHLLWNAVGGSSTGLHLEVHRATLEPGDRLLLCTDGLSKHVEPELLKSTLQAAPLEDACQQLIAQANEAGGSDNITAVVASFESPAPV